VFIFTNIFAVGIIITSFAMGAKFTQQDIMTCMYVLFSIQAVLVLHFIISAIWEMADALGIPAFSTWDPEAKKEIE